MSNYIETRVNHAAVQEDGREKKVSDLYLVDAVSFSEAENRIAEEVAPYISGEFDIKSVKKSNISELVTTTDELLKYRSLLVYQQGGRFVTIGGNMRLRAMRELRMTEAPCIVIDPDTTVEQLKAYTILDNSSFGQYDWDTLLNEWDTDLLEQWGVDLPINTDDDIEVPSVLEKDENDKPFTVKITFKDDAALNAFRDEYEENIKSEYDVTISVSGGKL